MPVSVLKEIKAKTKEVSRWKPVWTTAGTKVKRVTPGSFV